MRHPAMRPSNRLFRTRSPFPAPRSTAATTCASRNRKSPFDNLHRARPGPRGGGMFLCQPLLDVLIARGIEDIDSFIEPPSWNDLPDPESIPGMTDAVDRVLAAVRDKQRIAIFGDYDCDGILGTHILRSVLAS